MNKKKERENKIPPPKTTKYQGLVPPGRSNFIDEIIQKVESQASVGPQKGSTGIPQEENSQTAAHAEVHRGTEGIEQRFQIKHTPLSSPLDEVNSCNLKE
jgi:hypothetical protein